MERTGTCTCTQSCRSGLQADYWSYHVIADSTADQSCQAWRLNHLSVSKQWFQCVFCYTVSCHFSCSYIFSRAFFFFWHLADIKGQPILLVALQWLYIDVCMFIWYVIFLSINLWLFQVTLLSWKLVYQRTLVRLLRQCFHIVLSSCSIWMCYNDSWAELKKKKRSKLWFPNGYIGDVMKQGVVSLLAQLMSQRRCKHNSLTLMQNRTTQTKNAWKGSLDSNPFPLWSGWYATQPTQPPSLFLLPGTRHLNITYQNWQCGGTGQPTAQPLWIFFSVLYVVSNIW